MRRGRSSVLGLLAALGVIVAALFGTTGAAWATPCAEPGCQGGTAMTGSTPGGAGSVLGTTGAAPVPETCIQRAACGGGAASGLGGVAGLGLLAALGTASGACAYLAALRLRRRPAGAPALARGVTALVLRPPRFA